MKKYRGKIVSAYATGGNGEDTVTHWRTTEDGTLWRLTGRQWLPREDDWPNSAAYESIPLTVPHEETST